MRVQNKQNFKDLFQAALALQAEAGYQVALETGRPSNLTNKE